MQLPDSVVQAFTAHVLTEYPKEAVGIVKNDTYIPCVNIHPEPTKAFKINANEYLELKQGGIQCLLHSHPYDKSIRRGGDRPEYPSSKDIEGFNQGTFPWGIVATDGSGLSPIEFLDDSVIPPLEGRSYFWGIRDCYSVVRDWFRINRNVNIYNVPRQYGFWDIPGAYNPFLVFSTEDYGWIRIPHDKVEVGDACMLRMGDRHAQGIINHCGVVSGPNELLHHTLRKLSCKTELHKWMRSIASFHRYVGPK